MSTYAIGDLQGCFLSLQALLHKIQFSPANDRLWFVGDVVNRGPGSLECLRFVKQLGNAATMVLGNHDLHLLSVAEGLRPLNKNDTLKPILDAPDCKALLAWLRQQKLLHIEDHYALVHAGLLPNWGWPEAQALAHEIECALRGPQYQTLLQNMYGSEPDYWQADWRNAARQRVIINAMTRMRIISADGHMQLKFKGELNHIPDGCAPWFEAKTSRSPEHTIIAGHWSALGLHIVPHFAGLDSGCVWGRELTAMRLEDRAIFQVSCAEIELSSGVD